MADNTEDLKHAGRKEREIQAKFNFLINYKTIMEAEEEEVGEGDSMFN
jgi:hypothetical protein